MADEGTPPPAGRYFVVKVSDGESLSRSVERSEWAVPASRVGTAFGTQDGGGDTGSAPPQPFDVLVDACADAQGSAGARAVYLLVSVSGSKNYQAVGRVEAIPTRSAEPGGGAAEPAAGTDADADPASFSAPFRVTWEACVENTLSHGLPFSEIRRMDIADAEIACRCHNLDELPAPVGAAIAARMRDVVAARAAKRRAADDAHAGRAKEAFFEDSDAEKEGDPAANKRAWGRLRLQVERRLGRVLFACLVGSRRYNLAVESSDRDYWVVYAAPTNRMVSSLADPPPSCVKNPPGAKPDLTIFEVATFCQMLRRGDPRAVESLFAHPSTVLYQCSEFSVLAATLGMHLVTPAMAVKYRSDALGSKGLSHWRKHAGATPPAVLAKKLAISLRQLALAKRCLESAAAFRDGSDAAGDSGRGSGDNGAAAASAASAASAAPARRAARVDSFSCWFDRTSGLGRHLLDVRGNQGPFDDVFTEAEKLDAQVGTLMAEARKSGAAVPRPLPTADGADDGRAAHADAATTARLESWLHGLRSRSWAADDPHGRGVVTEPIGAPASVLGRSLLRAARTLVSRYARSVGTRLIYAAVPSLGVVDAVAARLDSADDSARATHTVQHAVWGLDVVFSDPLNALLGSRLRSEYAKMIGSHSSQLGMDFFDEERMAMLGALGMDESELGTVDSGIVECGGFTFDVWAHEAHEFCRLLARSAPRAVASVTNDDGRHVLVSSAAWVDLVNTEGLWRNVVTDLYVKNNVGYARGLLREIQGKVGLPPRKRLQLVLDLIALCSRAQDLLLPHMTLDAAAGAPAVSEVAASAVPVLALASTPASALVAPPAPAVAVASAGAGSDGGGGGGGGGGPAAAAGASAGTAPAKSEEKGKGNGKEKGKGKGKSKVKGKGKKGSRSSLSSGGPVDLSTVQWFDNDYERASVLIVGEDAPQDHLLARASTVIDGLETIRASVHATGTFLADGGPAEGALAEWLARLRRSLRPAPTMEVTTWQPIPVALESQMRHIGLGGMFDKIPPASVLFVVRSGSFMYDLHTPTSDEDYIVVFLQSTADVLSLKPPADRVAHHVHKDFGADKSDDIEFGAVELETFVADLCKGNPRNIEPLYTEKALFVSPLFAELRARRKSFLTDRAFSQYMGQIADRLGRIPKSANDAQKAKLLYHAFHKLFELKRIATRQDLHVAVVGEEREFIRRIRSGPFEGDFAIDALVERAEALISEIHVLDTVHGAADAACGNPRPAEVDVAPFVDWISDVRRRFA